MGNSCACFGKIGSEAIGFQGKYEVNILLKEFSINGAVYRSVEEYVISVEDQARVLRDRKFRDGIHEDAKE